MQQMQFVLMFTIVAFNPAILKDCHNQGLQKYYIIIWCDQNWFAISKL